MVDAFITTLAIALTIIIVMIVLLLCKTQVHRDEGGCSVPERQQAGSAIQEGGGPSTPGWGSSPPEQPDRSPFLNQPPPDSAPFSPHHLWVASRLSLSGYSGSAGPQSSLALEGTNFSTRDADNDNCLCKCAQMLSGGGCGVR